MTGKELSDKRQKLSRKNKNFYEQAKRAWKSSRNECNRGRHCPPNCPKLLSGKCPDSD